MIKSPQFWNKPPFFPWKLFLWISWVYGWFVQKRLQQRCPTKISVPVICVGNLTLGGVGKTPVVLSLAEHYLKKGEKVGFLTRGYGGTLKGPLQVNLNNHTAKEVGDEPLLLGRIAPTWVARDRVLGARQMVKKGITLIIMDDGYQNPFLYKDLSLIVVDGVQGFGNKTVFPLGPLREPFAFGLNRADGVIVVRPPSQALKEDLSFYTGEIIQAEMVLETSPPIPQKVVAFCGIGNPDKFFKSLEAENVTILERKSFPDHYVYKDFDLTDLKKKAIFWGVPLVTTEKDWVRLDKQNKKDVLPVAAKLKWKEWGKMKALLKKKVSLE